MGRSIHEARAVQQIQRALALWLIEIQRRWRTRRRPRGRLGGSAPMPVQRRPRNPQAAAGALQAHARAQLLRRRHQAFSARLVESGAIPNSVETFFWTSMRVCAWARRWRRRSFSRSRASRRCARDRGRLGLAPPYAAPGPSERRSRAGASTWSGARSTAPPGAAGLPISPASQRSASPRRPSLHWAVNLRRLALSATSGSLGTTPLVFSTGSSIAISFPPSYSNLPGGRYLTYIGTEGVCPGVSRGVSRIFLSMCDSQPGLFVLLRFSRIRVLKCRRQRLNNKLIRGHPGRLCCIPDLPMERLGDSEEV